jgi:predicted secreted protein
LARAHLLHIAKTGGTALKHALEPNLESHFGRIILHTHRTRLSDIPLGEAVMFVARNPAARFVSAFNHGRRHGRPRYTDAWTAAEAVAFERFKTADALATALSDTDAERREAALAGMSAIAHVKLDLTYWLGDVAYLRARRPDILWVGLLADRPLSQEPGRIHRVD